MTILMTTMDTLSPLKLRLDWYGSYQAFSESGVRRVTADDKEGGARILGYR
jgi:hypothetical protein